MSDAKRQSLESVKNRLDEIVVAVEDDGRSLDEALDLYEEAVKLCLHACELTEPELIERAADAKSSIESAAAGESPQPDAPVASSDPSISMR